MIVSPTTTLVPQKDHWAWRKLTEIIRNNGYLSGCGACHGFVELVAEVLDLPFSVDDHDEEEYFTWRFSLGGTLKGWVHDDCFFEFSGDDDKLCRAVLTAVFRLHEHYQNRRGNWDEPMRVAMGLLTPGSTLRVRSVRPGVLVLRRYPVDSGLLRQIFPSRVRLVIKAV